MQEQEQRIHPIPISIPNKINESELFTKYKSSYKSALLDLSLYTFLFSSSFYLLCLFRSTWLNALTIPFMTLMNVKTFIIFHDCGHGSYTPNKTLNYIIGSLLGVFVFTPFCWNYHHYNHHLTNGNINNKLNHKYNEMIFHSLIEYKKMNRVMRFIYKIVRMPCIYYIFIPIIFFGIKQRIDILKYKINKRYPFNQSLSTILFDTLFSNVNLLFFVYYLLKFEMLGSYLISTYLVAVIAFFMFHNQHTFNPPYVVNNEDWNTRNSGLLGSSFIQIHKYLKYFFHGIEYHHIHHINSKIPGYNLQRYHEDVVSKSNVFDNIVKLSMTDCYNNLWLVLYDETKNKYITFNEADEEIKRIKND